MLQAFHRSAKSQGQSVDFLLPAETVTSTPAPAIPS